MSNKWNINRIIAMGNNQDGFSLLESVISVFLIAALAVALLGSFTTAYKAVISVDEQYQAETLARSQMDSIKNQDYIDYSVPSHGTYPKLTRPDGYDIQITVVPINPATGQALGSGDDDIQKITIDIVFNGKTLKTLVDYKVNRAPDGV